MPEEPEADEVECVEDPELVGRLWLKAIGPIQVDLRHPPADGEESGPRVVFAREQALIAIYERISRIARSDMAGSED